MHRRVRNLAVIGTTIASAIVLLALGATGASASGTVAGNAGHATVPGITVVHATPVAVGASAATAEYELCTTTTGYCLWPAPHTDPYYITNYSAIAEVSFINEYTTSDGNAWYELSTGSGLCLNWGGPSNNFFYADSCQAGDANELFYNHVKGELINLAGNEYYDEDSYLAFYTCSEYAAGEDYCPLFLTNAQISIWAENPY